MTKRFAAEQEKQKELEQYLAMLLEYTPAIEVRALPPSNKGPRLSGFFQDAPSATQAIANIDGKFNVFVLPNPIKPGACRGALGQLKPAAMNGCAGNDDIEKRCWLPIDIDSKAKGGQSATDEEIARTADVARKICEFLSSEGWPAPFSGFSGNGNWLVYRIDLPNDQAAAMLVTAVLRALAYLFNEGDVQVDPAVANAARIIPAFGTLKMKGEDTPERPHRYSEVLSNGAKEIVTRAQLEALAEMLPQDAHLGAQAVAGTTWPNLKEVLNSAGIKHDVVQKGRLTWYNIYDANGTCPFGDGQGNGGKCGLGQNDNGVIFAKCFAAEHSLAEWVQVLKLEHAFPPSLISIKPIIIVNRPLPMVSDETWAVLANGNNPPTLFRYGGELVEVI